MNDTEGKLGSVARTAEVVAAYLAHQEVALDAVPGVIAAVHAALSRADAAGPSVPRSAEVKASPTAVRRSIRPDGLVSFIDGKPYKLLKRHLTTHGLTPTAYRARFGLPPDYPMVAAGYAQARSARARAQDFGQVRRRKAAATRAQRGTETA